MPRPAEHRRHVALHAAALALILVTGACQGPETTSETSPPGPAAVSMAITEPASIDPLHLEDTPGAEVARLLFDGLTDVDEELAVVPAVAASWTSSPDARVHTFRLRDDVTFSNGRKVTAGDFVFSLNRLADPDAASEVSYLGGAIQGWPEVSEAAPTGVVGDTQVPGVRAIDDVTLEITTTEPFALLPAALTNPVFSPVPREHLDTPEKAAVFAERPVGNGPYTMAAPWQHGERIEMSRRDGYRLAAAEPEVVELPIVSDEESAYAELEAGHVDVAAVPFSEVEAARAAFGERVVESEIGTVFFLGLPVTRAPYTDPRVRRALSKAIDRAEVANESLGAMALPAGGFVPAVAPDSEPEACPDCELDEAGARQLLEQAGGVQGGLRIYGVADGGYEDALQAIVEGWESVFGIEVTLVSEGQDAFSERIRSGGFDGPNEVVWSWDFPSAYSLLAPLFETRSSENLSGYSNPSFDALVQQARSAPDSGAARAPLQQAQRIVGTDLPGIPVAFARKVQATSDRVSNVRINGLGFTLLENVRVQD